MAKKMIALLGSLLFLASCACESSVKVQPMQRKDKLLTCKEVVLEVNEAEFFRRAAENNKNRSADIVLPFCNIHRVRSAETAMRSADERLEYLNQIYDLMGCARQRPNLPPAPPPVR